MTFFLFMKPCIEKILRITAYLAIISTPTYAQISGIISPNDAAVTGFSGRLNQSNNITFFDNNGPSVRIITLPGSGAFGFRNTHKPFTVTRS